MQYANRSRPRLIRRRRDAQYICSCDRPFVEAHRASSRMKSECSEDGPQNNISSRDSCPTIKDQVQRLQIKIILCSGHQHKMNDDIPKMNDYGVR